jgi:uncharacterized protein (DUF1810 family)
MSADDTYDLRRFVEAQNPVFQQVCDELRQGRKRSHWMWFIFPQIQGLGHSPTAVRFAISSKKEALAYSQHQILGARLRECTELVGLIQGRSVSEIFGFPDHLKFHSSMTLFAIAASDNQFFQQALQQYFGGKPDPQTLVRLK